MTSFFSKYPDTLYFTDVLAWAWLGLT